VSDRLPVVSGGDLIKALEKIGWEQVRQRGSHVRLKHPERVMALVIPLHRELQGRVQVARNARGCESLRRESTRASSEWVRLWGCDRIGARR
jgi:predicted RNA binding protein YcfA (HicA-like mRNA interferase family)